MNASTVFMSYADDEVARNSFGNKVHNYVKVIVLAELFVSINFILTEFETQTLQ